MALGRFQVYGGSFNVSLESFCLEEEQLLFSQSKLDVGLDLFDGLFWREWVSRDNLDEKNGNQGENGRIAELCYDCR